MVKYDLYQIVIELTKQCNLHCLHCGSSCDFMPFHDEFKIGQWKNCIAEAIELGAQDIVFSGGEPTLKDGFDELIAYIFNKGIKYAFITNGYKVPQSIFKVIANYKPYTVGVSIDGMKSVHNFIRNKNDSWVRVLKTIDKVKELGIGVCAITTINKKNLSDMDILADFLSGYVDSWQIQLAEPFGRMADRINFLIDEDDFSFLCQKIILYRKEYPNLYIQAADCFGMASASTIRRENWNGCSAGLFALGIDACGNVLPCLSLQADEFFCGNLKQKSLSEIWEKSSIFDFNRNFKKEDAKDGKCENCESLLQCRGGCASQSYSYYKRLHSSPFCYQKISVKRQK